MARQRASKIERYKKQKETAAKLKELQEKVDAGVTDDDVQVRRVTLVLLNLFEETWIYFFHFLSFLNTQMAQVVDILPYGRVGPVCPTQSIPWLLKVFQHEEQPL